MNYSDLLSYDKETGLFVWLVSRNNNSTQGSIAGHVNEHGYRLIGVGYKLLRAHRLAWFMAHGYWPKGQIDHINGNRDDNRICNLRDVNSSINNQNYRKAKSSNKTSGLLGVWLDKKSKKWATAITVGEKQIWIGRFNTPEEAHFAYLQKKRSIHAGCTI